MWRAARRAISSTASGVERSPDQSLKPAAHAGGPSITMAPMGSRTQIVLIRHGESEAQLAGTIAGHRTCSGLSPRGIEQAGLLAQHLAASGELIGAEAIYTSLLRRAQQTAKIISQAIGVAVASEDSAWCEIHPGVAEGLTWQQMRERYPPTGDPDDPVARRLPGMETWAEMYERVGQQLRTTAVQHVGETVVVVTSGGPVGASFVAFGGASFREGIAFTRATKNTSITAWVHDGRSWQLERDNETPHLSQPNREG